MCDTKLQHFGHEHPLFLCERKTTDDNDEEQKIDDEKTTAGDSDDDDIDDNFIYVNVYDDDVCNGCTKKISGSGYRCRDCFFSLHVICATLLPREMEHPEHHHPLHLLPEAPYRSSSFHCSACDKLSQGFNYHCSPCNFDLDLDCALRVGILKHQGHEHPLSPVVNPASFKCDACGRVNEELGLSYLCHTCHFWIHESCASLPSTINYGGHHHPLTLAYSPQFPAYLLRRINCCACGKKLKGKCWNYCCKRCRYNVHVHCSKRVSEIPIEETKFDEADLLRLPLPNEPTNLIERLIKRISQENTEEETHLNLQMIHEHTLTLFDGQSDYESYYSASGREESSYVKVCDACAQPVVDPPFYRCLVCDFSLHKWCSNLPNKLEVPYHPHRLNLRVKHHPDRRGFFKCSNCRYFSNGFGFHCDECDHFCVDVVCASLPDYILHEAHDHRLFQKRDCGDQTCVGCEGDLDGPVFGCRTCNFNLGLACALLPRTITHRFEKHSFNLTYAPIENGPDEYYCEFCEKEINPSLWLEEEINPSLWLKEINPSLWFYHCDECDQSACVTCVSIEKNLNATVKVGLGGKNNCYYDLDCHSHPLTLTIMQVTKHLGLLCHTCREPLLRLGTYLSYHDYCWYERNFAFTCAICNIVFHRRCADSWFF